MFIQHDIGGIDDGGIGSDGDYLSYNDLMRAHFTIS
jgi:hypothetical protein